ncbi:MAG: cupin [Euryarchaeota archaeon RBG_16_68_13]|nr:MAG: cupin [Euryarchaeota archaeon RBG_16_68_13]
MEASELAKLVSEAKARGKLYHEFLRVADLSAGVYVLPAGGRDPQSPHTEDEIYFVARGRATIRVGDEELRVGPGSVVFVKANVEHAFHDIEEELRVFVLFAPAEGTRGG